MEAALPANPGQTPPLHRSLVRTASWPGSDSLGLPVGHHNRKGNDLLQLCGGTRCSSSAAENIAILEAAGSNHRVDRASANVFGQPFKSYPHPPMARPVAARNADGTNSRPFLSLVFLNLENEHICTKQIRCSRHARAQRSSAPYCKHPAERQRLAM